MDQQKQHDIALMRYSVIAPLITGLTDDYPSLEAFYRDASAKGVVHPDGFDALIPTTRADLGVPGKLDELLQEQILYLKTNYPRMSSSAIYRQLRENGSIKAGDLSESTINRFINVISIRLKTTANQDMRRYELPHINEVWCGDSSVGPYLTTSDGKKHKVYIIALIDDASRFITGIDVFE